MSQLPVVPMTLVVPFVLLVLAVAALPAVGSAVAGGRLAEPAPDRRRRTLLALGATVIVLAVSAVLASRGAFGDFSAAPPALVRLVIPLTVLTVLVGARSSFGARLARGVPLAWLVGFQVFRVGVEAMLYGLHGAGALPEQMTFAGRNLDVLTGLSAPMVAWLVGRRGVLVWNVIGLALLGNIVAIAVLSVPGPWQRFHAAPGNVIVTGAPWVWLPAVLVQMALFGHILVFRALRQRA
jgi:hypothetical protein